MLFTNFAAGELSPMLNGRTDIQQYYQGVSRLLNFEIIPTGGIERRVGTQRVGQLSGECRLIPFILNKEINFIFELYPEKGQTTIHIWKNERKMVDLGGNTVELQGPWSSLSEIRKIQYAQNYNKMIFVEEDHEPYYLEYNLGEDSFTFGAMDFKFKPTVELDDDYNYIEVVDHLPINKNNSGYCLFDGYLYKWENESWNIDTTEYEIDQDLFKAPGKYPNSVAFFSGRLFFGGTRQYRQKVWGSAAPNIGGSRYNDFSTYVKYITVNKVIKDPDIHFFTADAVSDSDTLLNVSQDLTGIKDLSKYYVSGELVTEGTQPISATWDPMLKKGTLKLSLPVKSAGSRKVYSVQTWINRLDPSASDFEFKIANSNMTSADNGFNFEVASDQNDAIKWLATSTALVIGSESATYVMDPGSTALSQNVILNGRYGTDDIQATVIDNAVLFFSNGNRAVREYYWNQAVNSFVSNDLAIFNPRILQSSPAIDFDFRTNPYAQLLITKENGRLATMLYNRTLGIQAWGEMELGSGQIGSVAVVRGEKGCDYVYLAVKKDNNVYLEKLDQDNKIYLDSWAEYNPDVVASYPGGVLYNTTTNALCEDLTNIPTDFIHENDKVLIGFTYLSLVSSMPIMASNNPMDKKRIVKLTLRFYESYKPEIILSDKKEVFTDFPEPYSGIKEVDYPGQSLRDVYFTIAIEKPEGCNILSIGVITA